MSEDTNVTGGGGPPPDRSAGRGGPRNRQRGGGRENRPGLRTQPQFEGRETELKGHIFDLNEDRNADQFITTLPFMLVVHSRSTPAI